MKSRAYFYRVAILDSLSEVYENPLYLNGVNKKIHKTQTISF